jgi:hypothetical protein
VITLKSEPLTIQYDARPFFIPNKELNLKEVRLADSDQVEIKCNLYRILYLYPYKPFYTEELFVQTEDGTPISFRPYYFSLVHNPFGMHTEFKRFEAVPDYFALWKHYGVVQHWGYGFAADAHVRGIEMHGDEIRWRLPLSHHNKCVHYFMFHGFEGWPPPTIDLLHEIGHHGWYEQVFKPLEAIPLTKRYPAPVLRPDERDEDEYAPL